AVPVDGQELGLEGERLQRLEGVADAGPTWRPLQIAAPVDVADDRAIQVDAIGRACPVDRDELGWVARPASSALRPLETGVRAAVAEEATQHLGSPRDIRGVVEIEAPPRKPPSRARHPTSARHRRG